MNLHWLLPCTHMVFVIDRIEPPYVVIEWAHSTMVEDVPQTEFPTKPREGQVWTVHMKMRPKRKKHATRFDWTSKEENPGLLPHTIRLTEMTAFRQEL